MDTDALFRIPWVRRYEVFDKIIDKSAMKAIICASMVNNHSNTAVRFSPILHYEQEDICSMGGKTTPKKMTNKGWVDEQMADPIIGEVHKHLLDKALHKRKSKRGDSEALKKLLKHQ